MVTAATTEVAVEGMGITPRICRGRLGRNAPELSANFSPQNGQTDAPSFNQGATVRAHPM